jgi:hypothetical protein
MLSNTSGDNIRDYTFTRLQIFPNVWKGEKELAKNKNCKLLSFENNVKYEKRKKKKDLQ